MSNGTKWLPRKNRRKVPSRRLPEDSPGPAPHPQAEDGRDSDGFPPCRGKFNGKKALYPPQGSLLPPPSKCPAERRMAGMSADYLLVEVKMLFTPLPYHHLPRKEPQEEDGRDTGGFPLWLPSPFQERASSQAGPPSERRGRGRWRRRTAAKVREIFNFK